MLCLAWPAGAAEPPPERLLADAARRVDRGDHVGALERLKRIDNAPLAAADEARRTSVAADAHLMAAIHDDTADPGWHLSQAVRLHQVCVSLQGPGQVSHARHCQGEQKRLAAAVLARAALLATTLEFGSPVAPRELEDRCAQLLALNKDDPGAARCLARVAWARRDADAAGRAFQQAASFPPSDTRDAALAQAASTLLRGLGDVQATQDLLRTIPASERGARLTAVQASVDVYVDKLAPLEAAALAPDAPPAAWATWLSALADATLFELALAQADRASALPPDARLWLVIASVRTRAAAAVPTTGSRNLRNRRIHTLLSQASDALQACTELPDAPATCAAQQTRVQAQVDALAAQLE